VDTHSHRDTRINENEPEIKPDVSLYVSGCRRDPSIITDISLIDVHMEFKLNPNDDPFRDHGTFEHDTCRSADTRGQITCYTTKQLASQFRTHAFSVVICKDTARLIHWDRSGAVVTQSFSYVEEAWLANFFWRYTHSSQAVRGIDESVTALTDANAPYVQRARVALELDDGMPLFRFAIYSEEGDVSYCFGSKPWFKGNESPTGRATRVFIVYDPVLDRRVLMKDTWRVSLKGMQTEGAVYRRLHAASVSHIPRFLRGGDVTSPFCRTRSHKFARRFGLRLRPHSHYRLILDDIGHDLTSFTTTKELVETMTGALQGT
jgi:Fungal protein kinase